MPLVYESIYNPEMLGLESEDEVNNHRTAATKLAQISMSTIPHTCDPIVIILTTCIILYTTDFVDLDDPKRVEDVQTAYACLLWRWYQDNVLCNLAKCT